MNMNQRKGKSMCKRNRGQALRATLLATSLGLWAGHVLALTPSLATPILAGARSEAVPAMAMGDMTMASPASHEHGAAPARLDGTASDAETGTSGHEGMGMGMGKPGLQRMPVEQAAAAPSAHATAATPMRAQGGAAPPDARDPHAHADGMTLESGPYALSGPRQLRLADEHAFTVLRLNRLEHVWAGEGGLTAYEASARIGRDYDALLVRSEGEFAGGRLREARSELLWSHAVAPFWDLQFGLRLDHGAAPSRQWLAFGVQGLAPYWFELDATAYLGPQGRSALRLAADYELLLTQKLILQPHAEANFFGRSDLPRALGSGLSDIKAGLQLRYEFDRQIAPYIGVEWSRLQGQTASLARASGELRSDTRWVAGLRLWY